ncbi:hypothetical protein BAY61_16390 [Prauserella marina]|uniref:Uncharacterized protein n=1 Tax=Prauserella marina TaxID=530584 RepID=A0A222VQW4_9PSEU|nr:hypothetical protein [Prauserella marina]ASR36325.1 hypothetical protein BAY61_16390 [Prauserella marina]PWV77108.1 hypothetical protein DES30_105325 [Prauserella marina]SDD04612.1 hypothetical protein SAMN05421630_105326 [Prauserella marina]
MWFWIAVLGVVVALLGTASAADLRDRRGDRERGVPSRARRAPASAPSTRQAPVRAAGEPAYRRQRGYERERGYRVQPGRGI